MASFGGAPEQAPRWDLVGTECCGGGIRFLAPYLIVWGYVGIYRRKEYVRYLIGRIVKTYDYINRVMLTLPLSVYEGTWTTLSSLVAMHHHDHVCA